MRGARHRAWTGRVDARADAAAAGLVPRPRAAPPSGGCWDGTTWSEHDAAGPPRPTPHRSLLERVAAVRATALSRSAAAPRAASRGRRALLHRRGPPPRRRSTARSPDALATRPCSLARRRSTLVRTRRRSARACASIATHATGGSRAVPVVERPDAGRGGRASARRYPLPVARRRGPTRVAAARRDARRFVAGHSSHRRRSSAYAWYPSADVVAALVVVAAHLVRGRAGGCFELHGGLEPIAEDHAVARSCVARPPS